MNSTTVIPRTCQDSELVKLAVNGDQRAFSSLLERYRGSVYHTLYRMVRDREDANDLTIEAFGKAFDNLESYTPRYAFSTWLFRIAINNCIDFIRKKRLHTYSLDEPMGHDADAAFSDCMPGGGINPEDQLINRQKLGYVRWAVNRLSHKYRLMIELRYFEERSYEEIAQELDIPLGTVKAQLYRAKRNLHHLMEQPAARAYHDMRRRAM